MQLVFLTGVAHCMTRTKQKNFSYPIDGFSFCDNYSMTFRSGDLKAQGIFQVKFGFGGTRDPFYLESTLDRGSNAISVVSTPRPVKTTTWVQASVSGTPPVDSNSLTVE
jgi:hypothetical protein